ncbi:MAG: hypothetical protein AAGA69_10000, partial [Pseudomonadota bacterium]
MENAVTVTTRVQPLSAEAWQISYSMDVPVASLTFRRSSGDHRRNSWRLRTEEMELVRLEDEDILRRKDGDVFSEVDALLTPHRGNITKEYLMFGAFSHGAQRVYAGQFRVRASVDSDAAPVETKHLLTMTPGIFEKLYAKGKWHTELVTLDGYTDEQDGYVVFGDVPVT